MGDLNFYQMQIINSLILNKKMIFSKLNISNLSSDQFSYHLRRLIQEDFIIKYDDNSYSLTKKGEEFADRIDIFSASIEKQPSVIACCICTKEENGQTYYLIHKRKKSPFYDYLCFPGGKVKFGEMVDVAALRELKEEVGIEGTAKFVGIIQLHKINQRDKKLFSDHVIYYFHIENLTGELKDTAEGENIWMNSDEIKEHDKKLFHDISTGIGFLKNNELKFLKEVDEYELD